MVYNVMQEITLVFFNSVNPCCISDLMKLESVADIEGSTKIERIRLPRMSLHSRRINVMNDIQ